MPQVPTQDYPLVKPESPPDIRGKVTAEAFGGDVGKAQQAFGSELDKFGDVMAKHALKMQSDLNHATSNEMFVNATVQAGELKTKLMTLQGKDAATFYANEYIPQLKKIEQDAAATAPNAEVKRLFQNDFKRRMGFDIENGAGYSATQMKHYQLGTSEARVQLAVKTGAETNNPKEIEAQLEEVDKATKQQSEIKGLDPESAKLKSMEARSKVWVANLDQRAQTDPIGAMEKFKEIRSDLDLPSQTALEKRLTSGLVSKGSRVIAEDVMKDFSPDDGKGTLQERVEEARKKSEEIHPGNQTLADMSANRVRARYNDIIRQRDDLNKARVEVVQNAIAGGYNAGDPPKSLEDMIGGEETVRDAYENMSPKDQIAVQKALERNAKGAVPLTPERLKRIGEIEGMRYTNPDGFTNMNIYKEDLPQGELLRLTKLQQAAKKEPVSVSVTHARSVVSDQVNAAGLNSKPSASDEEKKSYSLFVSSLADRVTAWETENKKKIPDAEVRKISAELLIKTEIPNSGWLWNDKKFQFETNRPAPAAAPTKDQTRAPVRATPTYAPTERSVPDGAIELLRTDPSKAAAFDAKYGPGASDKYLVWGNE